MDIFLRLLTTTSAFLLISLECTAMDLQDEPPGLTEGTTPHRAYHQSHSPPLLHPLNGEAAQPSLTHLPTSDGTSLPPDILSTTPGVTHQAVSSSLLPFSADESLEGASCAKPSSETFPPFFDPHAPWLLTSFSTFFTPPPPPLSIRALRKHLSPSTLTELILPAAPRLDIKGICVLIGASLPFLTKLDLRGHKIEDEGATALAEAVWPQLEVLHLEDNDIGPKGGEALAQNPNWPELVFFGLAGNKLGNDGIQRLILGRCASKSRDVCTKIDVKDNGIGPDWAEDLRPTDFTRLSLTGLSLQGNRMGDEPEPEKSLLSRRFPTAALYLSSLSASLFSVSEPPQFLTFLPDSLVTLNLSGCRLGGKEIRALASRALPQLRTLYLNNDQIDDERFGILTQGQWPKLAELYLDDNSIGTDGIKSLVTNRGLLSTLSVLSLENNRLDEDTLRYLTQVLWPALEVLNLSNNVIGMGLESLEKTKDHFPKLKELNLSDNLIGDSAKHLVGSWRALQILILRKHNIRNVEELEEHLRRYMKDIVLYAESTF